MILWKPKKERMLVLVLMAFLVFPSALAINADTNLTLRSICTNQNNNPCTDTARWTVIYPNGSTHSNNTLGGSSSYGVNNYTIWFNKTGNWYIYANFSSQNVTREWNVIVEAYDTEKITSTWSAVAMMGGLILFGMIIFSLFYAAFKLDAEHQLLKWLMFSFGLILFFPAIWIIRLSITTSTSINSILDSVLIIFMALILVLNVYYFVHFIPKFVKKSKEIAEEARKANGGRKE